MEAFGSVRICAARQVVGIAAGLILAGIAGPLRAQVVPANQHPVAGWHDASLDEYRTHLQELETLTAGCAKARNSEACDPARVGLDDRVPWGKERRLVRFGWLRVLLVRAQQADDAAKAQGAVEKAGAAIPPSDVRSTSQLLEDAQARMAADLALANAGPAAGASHASERSVLAQVLGEREFRGLKQRDQGETALEKFNDWLNHMFEWLGRQQVRAAWVGRLLIWGFLLAVSVGLAWALLQMERRWRVRLVPESEGPAPAAASARDWQLWLKDAQDAAAAGRWREAIHFLYWAAISRLESKKLWPADRARTAREYLALMAEDDPRRVGLGALTRQFERTWYGGRYAGEGEYERADELASALVESAPAILASRGREQ